MRYAKVIAAALCVCALLLCACDRNGPELDTVESIEEHMVTIPGGSFKMGCSDGDSDCDEDELPQHEVTISSFKISAYEVTQGQWEAVMGENPSSCDDCGDDCPVEDVSWDDVQDFIKELNSLTGMQYRLPTEAEWEYAARAGTTTKYYCGDDESCLDTIAWYAVNSDGTTHRVGQKTPNAWGLYDMSGNVWEWVSDWYDFDYYEISTSTDPQGPASGDYRVLRGGGWESSYGGPEYCRSSFRFNFTPPSDYSFLGFRLALSQQIPPAPMAAAGGHQDSPVKQAGSGA